MRRLLAAVALGGLALLGAAGCGRRRALGKVQRSRWQDRRHLRDDRHALPGRDRAPLAVATAGGTILIGDWATGRVYELARA